MKKLRRWGRVIIKRWTGLTGSLVSLFVFLVLLNILDYQTTNIVVGLTDFSVEANPVHRLMMEAFGTTNTILWFKGVTLVTAALVFRWCLSKAENEGRVIEVKRMLNACLMGLCFVYALIVIWNTHGIYLLSTL